MIKQLEKLSVVWAGTDQCHQPHEDVQAGVTGMLKIKHWVERKLSEKGENNKRNCKWDWTSRNKFTKMKSIARLWHHYWKGLSQGMPPERRNAAQTKFQDWNIKTWKENALLRKTSEDGNKEMTYQLGGKVSNTNSSCPLPKGTWWSSLLREKNEIDE